MQKLNMYCSGSESWSIHYRNKLIVSCVGRLYMQLKIMVREVIRQCSNPLCVITWVSISKAQPRFGYTISLVLLSQATAAKTKMKGQYFTPLYVPLPWVLGSMRSEIFSNGSCESHSWDSVGTFCLSAQSGPSCFITPCSWSSTRGLNHW